MGAANGDDEARQSRAFLDSIVDNLPNMVFVKDARELRFVRFNRAGEDLVGYSREDMLGKNDYDLFPEQEADFFTSKDREVLAGRDIVDIPAEVIDTRHQGQRILHTRKIPILGDDGEPEFLLGISEDITEQLAAAEVLHDREQTLRAIFDTSPDAMIVLNADLTVREASDAITRIAGRAAGAGSTSWLDTLHPDDAAEVAAASARLVSGDEEVVEVRFRLGHADGHWVPVEARGRGMRDADGTPAGAVVVLRDITDRLAAEEELLAERAVVEVLQLALLPPLPRFDDVAVAGTYRPAGAQAVGGDWYDAFPLPEGRIGLVVGDVAGHGLTAGALMAQLRNAARTLAVGGRTPGDALTELNDLMRRLEPARIATAVVAVIDPATRQFTWSCAGHPPVVLWDRQGGARLLGPVDGPPLGAIDEIGYGERSDVVAEDAVVVLYTDGLVERRDETLDEGLARLVGAVGEVAGSASLADVCGGLCDRLLPDGPSDDDVCILALRTSPPPP